MSASISLWCSNEIEAMLLLLATVSARKLEKTDVVGWILPGWCVLLSLSLQNAIYWVYRIVPTVEVEIARVFKNMVP